MRDSLLKIYFEMLRTNYKGEKQMPLVEFELDKTTFGVLETKQLLNYLKFQNSLPAPLAYLARRLLKHEGNVQEIEIDLIIRGKVDTTQLLDRNSTQRMED